MSNVTPKSKNVSYLGIILTQLAYFDIRQIACSQKKKMKIALTIHKKSLKNEYKLI